MSLPKSVSTLIITATAALLIACGSDATPAAPALPDTPVPATTAEPVVAASKVPQPPLQIQRQMPASAGPPTAMPTPTTQARADFVIPSPKPTETVEPTPVPTATTVPTPEPTLEPTPRPVPVNVPVQTAVSIAEPTAEPTPEPTSEPTAEPTPEPTSEPTAEPTSEPTATPIPLLPPQILIVDFYAGNTFQNPGPENCNRKRCGGATIQFSKPVLVHGNPVIDVLGKGLIRCIEGCSKDVPSPYIILSGPAWIEPNDTIVDFEIKMDGIGSITDRAGTEIESYLLGNITARQSDYAIVQGPVPTATPVPQPRGGEPPHVHRVRYEGTTLELHLTEPVITSYRDITDVGVIVRHANGQTERGTCTEPCIGDNAILTFSVPGMKASSIATRFELLNGAEIYDEDDWHVEIDFENVVRAQASVIDGFRVSKVDPDGVWWPYNEIQVSVTRPVWINATEMYIESNTGVRIPFDGQFSPKYLGSLLLFSFPLDVPEENIPKLYEGDVLERFVTDGWMETEDGLAIQNITFDPITLTR